MAGVSSLLGMAVSFGVIFKFVLPRIAAGDDPVVVAILGSLVIIPATFLLSHGVNRKTWVAVAGTLIALVVTGVMASVFVKAANLTGFASEEAGFLQAYNPGLVNIKGILLAGIIIGVLGVLDDITVSQSGIVEQLKRANSKLKAGELYRQAMVVGKDHIASMVNTLILVYTGAALPLLLLFVDNPRPFVEIVNYEIIADEVVRTLVGSIDAGCSYYHHDSGASSRREIKMETLIYILGATLLISSGALVGIVTLAMQEERLEKILLLLVSLSAGALMGGAFLHLLPEAVEELGGGVFEIVLVAFVGFFVLEKVLHWRHCHKGRCGVHSFGYLNLFGDAIHNFIDGLVLDILWWTLVGNVTTLGSVARDSTGGDFGVLLYAVLRKEGVAG